MDESNHGGSTSSLPPFLTKTYEMVNESSSDSIVSWSQSNKSFIVWNPPEFSSDLLPKFFKHNNFSSFIRQLNTYGFRKADPEKWEFANDDFVRGQPLLMRNIRRRKTVHSHSLTNLNPLSDLERRRMNDEVERLVREKQVLLVELKKQKEEREKLALQVKELKDQLLNKEKREKLMVSSVSHVLEKPSLALNQRKRKFKRMGLEEKQTCVVAREEELESSIRIWKNLVSDSCESMVQSVDVDESSTRPTSPSCCPRIVDMNLEPKEQNIVASPPQVTGVNDVFWQQFFTEDPGSTEQKEVQSERKEDEDRSEKCWWSSRSVVNSVT